MTETMKAVHLLKPVDPWTLKKEDVSEYFSVVDVPKPVPRRGEVLVKILRGAINPSDLSTLEGSYSSKAAKAFPMCPGYEGSGIVVFASAGPMGWRLLGQRVGFVMPAGRSGTWAEYAAVPATQCLVLPAQMPSDGGAYAFVNPLTVLAFFEIANTGKPKHIAIAQTAAASALGKMVIRLGKARGIRVLNIVRRADQIDSLVAEGALREDCFVSSNESWLEDFTKAAADLNCRICYDAVGGDLSGQILNAMPAKSTVYVYGGLSKSLVGNVAISSLIFQQKTLTGFWLTDYIQSKWMLGLVKWQMQVTKLLPTLLNTAVAESLSMDLAGEAVVQYCSAMTNGKVCIAPTALAGTRIKGGEAIPQDSVGASAPAPNAAVAPEPSA